MNDRSSSTRSRTRPPSRFPVRKVKLPPGAVAEGTRRRILEAALRLFASRGFHGTSVRDLAQQVKLQPGALYVHFPSKEHLLAELARVGHELHHEALRAALLDAGAAPAEQLRALVRAHATVHASHPELAIVVNEELYALPGELAAPALALRKQSAALLVDVLTRGVKKRSFHCRNVLVTAAAIGAMGLRIPYWYRREDGLDLDALSELHAELALRMLGVHPAGDM